MKRAAICRVRFARLAAPIRMAVPPAENAMATAAIHPFLEAGVGPHRVVFHYL